MKNEVARQLHREYADALDALRESESWYVRIAHDYARAKAQIVTAVNAARDAKDKPLYSNEALRDAEITVRLDADPVSAQFRAAEAQYKAARYDRDRAKMACSLWLAARLGTDDENVAVVGE